MSPVTAPRPRPRWIGLAGPTASGKTALALTVARELPVEIVSVDSALVYRGMDIGSAKPTRQEQAQAPHHLLDILDPAERYSAARFVQDATACMADIHARGRLPLLVGGTMLYFKALIEGLDAMPAADAAVRAELDAEAAVHGWPALHARLASVDPVTAQRLSPNDSQRIQRALEVWTVTGRPLSAFHQRAPVQDAGADADHVLYALEPQDRSWLHHRIEARFRQMMASGFLDEVRVLRQRGDLHTQLPAIRCVGYRQAWEALDEGLEGDALVARVLERGVAATRQLAKRQMTWLRSMRRVTLLAEQPDERVILHAHSVLSCR